MIDIDGEMKNMEGLVDFHEAAWVHKKDGVYYLSYSDNHDDAERHNRMRYATSDNPLGPWKHQGIFMEPADKRSINQNFCDQPFEFSVGSHDKICR